MNSTLATWSMIIVGAAVLVIVNQAVPITLDNMRWHLNVTGAAAAVIGLGLSRTRLGRAPRSRP